MICNVDMGLLLSLPKKIIVRQTISTLSSEIKFWKMANAKILNQEQFEQDVLNLDTAAVMKKYKVNKQAVYDKRYALKKKAAQSASKAEVEPQATVHKTRGRKPGKKSPISIPVNEQTIQNAFEQPVPVSSKSREIPVRTIDRPVQFSFDRFTVKLNSMPQKVYVNPETQAIEIDL